MKFLQIHTNLRHVEVYDFLDISVENRYYVRVCITVDLTTEEIKRDYCRKNGRR